MSSLYSQKSLDHLLPFSTTDDSNVSKDVKQGYLAVYQMTITSSRDLSFHWLIWLTLPSFLPSRGYWSKQPKCRVSLVRVRSHSLALQENLSEYSMRSWRRRTDNSVMKNLSGMIFCLWNYCLYVLRIYMEDQVIYFLLNSLNANAWRLFSSFCIYHLGWHIPRLLNFSEMWNSWISW